MFRTGIMLGGSGSLFIITLLCKGGKISLARLVEFDSSGFNFKALPQ